MTDDEMDEIIRQPPNWKLKKMAAIAFRLAGFLLVATVWISAGLFGLYILAFYASSLFGGNLDRWNNVLPGLYQDGSPGATTSMGLHFATGAVILLLGNIQLIETIRTRYPAFHRWIGRLYILSSVLAAVGGLLFIIIKGTVGGTVMNIGFSLYGVLMFISGIQTYRYAVAGKIDKHRSWALRLYALAIGSWLFRMDYGFWVQLTDSLGHSSNFKGPFDRVMSFFFFIPNLLVAELFIRSRNYKISPFLHLMATILLLFITTFLLLGTYYFTKIYWGPAIIEWIYGS